ncbi:MAG: AAA family ATPase [Actinomycetota bacterium]
MTRRTASSRFVGRVSELERGHRAVDALFDHDGADRIPLVIVAGEAGIGKTRFLDELLADARARGAFAARGQCVEHGGEVRPLSAIVDLLDDLGREAAELGVTLAAELEPLVRPHADGSPTTLSEAPARLDEQVASALRDVSAHRSLVVAVEDLHWADETTRRLLLSIVRARGLDGVLVVLTYRDDELHRRHPLLPFLADLERSVRSERIGLSPLDESEVAELATSIRGDLPSVDAVRELTTRSGGIPFYAEELLTAESDERRPPAGARHVILARLQRLDPAALRCAQAAAVLTAPIDPLVLRDAAGLDTDFHAALDDLHQDRLLVESGLAAGFGFRHDLIREVLLDELLPGERTELFGRAARSLRRHRPDRLGEIARLHATAMELPEALAASVGAATEAEAIGAMAEASEHHARCLDVWDRVADPASVASITRLELLRRAARAADLARDFDRAVELGRLAADEAAGGDPLVEGAVLRELAQYLWDATAPGIDEVLERALEVLPAEPPTVERAKVQLRRAGRLLIGGRTDEADALFAEVADAAGELGEPAIEADARASIRYHDALLGDGDVMAALYDHLATARSVDDGRVLTRIAINLTNALFFLGRYQEVVDVHDDTIAITERHGLLPTFGLMLQGNTAQALEPLGRWDDAAVIADDITLRHGAENLERWAPALLGWAQIELHRGHHDRVAPIYERGLQLYASGYYDGDLAQLAYGLIQTAASGDTSPVDLDTVGRWLEELPVSQMSLGARVASTAAHHLVPPPGDPDHESSVARVTHWMTRIRAAADERFVAVPPVLDVWLRQAAAELDEARGEPAPSEWARLVDDWESLDCPFFAATARFRRADALLRLTGGRSAADRAAATELLDAARLTADRLGARPLLDDIEDLAGRARLHLARTEAPAQASTTAAPFGLTERELEVIHLVMEGKSNGEIGATLFVSRKTASVHVSNILRKLGAANRIEAAAIARRHGL